MHVNKPLIDIGDNRQEKYLRDVSRTNGFLTILTDYKAYLH